MLMVAAVAALAATGCGGDDEEKTVGRRWRAQRAGARDLGAGRHRGGNGAGARGRDRAGPGRGARHRRARRASGIARARMPQGVLREPGVRGQAQRQLALRSGGPIRARPRPGRSTFTRTRWVMRGVGSKPMRGKALGIDGTLKVNGSARGRLIRAEGERIRFRQTGSRGTVKLSRSRPDLRAAGVGGGSRRRAGRAGHGHRAAGRA